MAAAYSSASTRIRASWLSASARSRPASSVADWCTLLADTSSACSALPASTVSYARTSASDRSWSSRARASATIAAASAPACSWAWRRTSAASASSASRWPSVRRASSISGGMTSRSSSSRSSTCSRGTTQEPDIGTARAVSTSSASSLSSSSARRSGCVVTSRGSSRASQRVPQRAPASEERSEERSGAPRRGARSCFVAALGSLDESLEDGRRDESGDVTAPSGDVLDQARRQEAVLGVGGHEQGVDTRQAPVHLRHLQLVVEVAHGPKTLDDHRDVVGLAVVDGEAAERVDANLRELAGRLLQHRDALVHGEQPGLVAVDEHGDDDLVVQARGTFDDVEVAVGHRVERTRANDPSHLGFVSHDRVRLSSAPTVPKH